jgi:hypothetical protein
MKIGACDNPTVCVDQRSCASGAELPAVADGELSVAAGAEPVVPAGAELTVDVD